MQTYTTLSNYIFRPDASLLFDPKTGIQHNLNETSVVIIQELLNGKTVLEVAQSLSEEFGIPCFEICQDIETLLTELSIPTQMVRFIEFEKDLNIVPEFPFAIELELTKLCNWNCEFCYNVWKIDKNGYPKQGAIKYFDLRRLFEILKECKTQGLLRVRYSGGEPTLHPNFQEIIEYGSSLGFYQVIFTNGHSLDQNTARAWKKSNIQEVLISLHGPERVHNKLTGKTNAFKCVINAIQNCLEVGLDIVVEMTLTSKNVTDVLDTIKIVKTLGVEQVRIMRYVPRGKDDLELMVSFEVLSKLITQLETIYGQKEINIRFPCSQRFCLSEPIIPIDSNPIVELRNRYLVQQCHAGINWLSISYDGKLKICPHSNVYLADISAYGKSIKEAWNTNVKNTVIQIITNQKMNCNNCKAINLCLGGCYLNHFS